MSKILFTNQVILENDFFKVAQDWEIPIPAFFIVASKRKAASLVDFSQEEMSQFIQTTAKVRRAMKNTLGINEVYLFQNEDSEHGFHLWIFPRYEWMEKFGRKIESVRPIMEFARENMADEKTINEVLAAVKTVKDYLNKGKD